MAYRGHRGVSIKNVPPSACYNFLTALRILINHGMEVNALQLVFESNHLAVSCMGHFLPGPFLLSYSVFDFIFPYFFRFWAVRAID